MKVAYKLNGQEVSRAEFTANPSPALTSGAHAKVLDWKPLHCEAMAVDGCTADAARAIDAQLGAPLVNYDNNGCPVFHDKATYDKYLKAHGKVNRTSGKGHHALTGALLERVAKRIVEQHS
jgi:hypothetical protein